MLDIQEKKIILFECIVIACADGKPSPMELFVINEICKTFGLDEELIDEFTDICGKVSALYKESLEIITE